jgi:hypothetical protein
LKPCSHRFIRGFITYQGEEPVETGTSCADCGKVLTRQPWTLCGAVDPSGKGTCELPGFVSHEVHRRRISKGGHYSRLAPERSGFETWIEGELCWRETPEEDGG